MSSTGLRRLHEAMAGYAERGDMPGIVTMVSRRGEVQVDTIGTTAIGGNEPIERDAIFRLASLTKPITAAAAMILVDEGRLRLDEPVDRLLPELASRQVLKRLDGPLDDTVPAIRPITVLDVLTFRMGFGIVMSPPDTYPILKAVHALQIGTMGPPKPGVSLAPDDWIARLGSLPLMHQPGDRWMYNTSSSVLGVLIARASGQPLETFMRERIFEPLGMDDTGFSVPAAKLNRLSVCYEVEPETGALALHDGVDDSQWSDPPAFPDGAAGLVSTADDYYAFGQMMLNRGMSGNKRILSEQAVEAMTTDQLSLDQKAKSDFYPGFWEGRGWGFGLTIITGADEVSAAPGRFGWDGGYGTSWYADPGAGMTAVMMSQRLIPPETMHSDFWRAVYQALDD